MDKEDLSIYMNTYSVIRRMKSAICNNMSVLEGIIQCEINSERYSFNISTRESKKQPSSKQNSSIYTENKLVTPEGRDPVKRIV